MKRLLLLSILISTLLSSCDNSQEQKDAETPKPTEVIKLEDASIPVPPLTVTMTASGNARVFNITGRIVDMSFHRSSLGQNGGSFSYWFDLNFDQLKETKRGPNEAPDLAYTFVRNGPYSYTLTHNYFAGEKHLLVVSDTRSQPTQVKQIQY